MSLVEAVAHARAARSAALLSVLEGDPACVGLARPGTLRVEGPDAGRFLQSQLTDDALSLQPGTGHAGARVTRTGHLGWLFTVHRDADGDGYRLLLEADEAPRLAADLDAFLFADRATLTVEPARVWVALVGPAVLPWLDAALGPVGFEPWSTLPDGALRPLRRAKGGLVAPEGSLAVRRALGGDVGVLLGFPDAGSARAWADALVAARPPGAEVVGERAFSDALELLRLEAGQPRLGPDTAGRRRLLPETGQEHVAVSYTKGCYLGQEVIARVRTYGSVPHLLRALVLDGPAEPDEAVLAGLPAPGEDLVEAGTGAKVGALGSRGFSPTLGRPIVLAYLPRDRRAPGQRLTLDGPAGPWSATVATLPLYAAADTAARVQQLYEDAIRTFAAGDTDRALAGLEDALRLDPGYADAYEAIGVILGRAERFHEAIDVFRRLEEVAPDEPMVHTNLSLYLMKLGDKAAAEDEAGKATLKQMARAAGKDAGKVDADLEKGKVKDAARKRVMFEKVLLIDPDDAIALFGLGNALLVLDEPEAAERHLARALEVDRTNSPVYAARGKALERLGRVDDAVATYKAGVEVASRKGDLMPLKEMEHRLLLLGAR